MGLGLASTRNTPKGTTVAYFVGELLSILSDEYKREVRLGLNRYMLGIGKFFVLDCFPNLENCKASRCNSFKNAGKWIKAIKNCELAPDTKNGIVRIKAIRNIERFSEFFIDYGAFYHFQNNV